MNITLKYITNTETTDTITIKDFNFKWVEVLWEDQGVSITGKKRNLHRGYQAVLELNFEYDEQLNAVAENIKSTLDDDGVIQYIDSGAIPVVPSSYESRDDYVYQINRKPSTLVLEGDIQDTRTFIITGILCGSTVVTCGQTDVLCGA